MTACLIKVKELAEAQRIQNKQTASLSQARERQSHSVKDALRTFDMLKKKLEKNTLSKREEEELKECLEALKSVEPDSGELDAIKQRRSRIEQILMLSHRKAVGIGKGGRRLGGGERLVWVMVGKGRGVEGQLWVGKGG